MQQAPSIAGVHEGEDDRKQGTERRWMQRQRAPSMQRVAGEGPSSLILLQWKDESGDAYDRLKAQMCQSKEKWFFNKKMKLIHRIQKE